MATEPVIKSPNEARRILRLLNNDLHQQEESSRNIWVHQWTKMATPAFNKPDFIQSLRKPLIPAWPEGTVDHDKDVVEASVGPAGGQLDNDLPGEDPQG